MISYLGTPPVAIFEIDANVVGKYVIFSKCCHSPNTEYEICMYLQWKFSLNIMLISMIFCSVRYLHMPEHAAQNCHETVEFWQRWFDFMFGFFPLMLTYLKLVHLPWSQIPKQSMKALHKTGYETVEYLWRYTSLYICLFTLCSSNSQCLNLVHFVVFLGSSGYLSTALRCSPKPFTKWLGCCGGKSLNVPSFTLLLTPFSLP